MKHLIYTVDIASPLDLPDQFAYDLMMVVDKWLEDHPLEFEDWKTSITREERNV